MEIGQIEVENATRKVQLVIHHQEIRRAFNFRNFRLLYSQRKSEKTMTTKDTKTLKMKKR